MTDGADKVPAKRGWTYDNPYLLLGLAALFWSGNHIVGRAIGGEVPPLGISTVRWLLPTLALGILAFSHIRRDWPVIRATGASCSGLASSAEHSSRPDNMSVCNTQRR